MAKHPKNQHFVPRFLLNYFADNSRNIWCYDKLWKRTGKKGIGGVAFEEYLYDMIPGEKEGSLEYIYQRAETQTAPIIQKIVSNNSLNCITKEEKKALSVFIILQLNRTKASLKDTERFQTDLFEKIKSFAEANGVPFELDTLPVKELWVSKLEHTSEHSEILMRKVWYLGTSKGEFYTSDHPVVRGNYKNKDISHIRGVYGLNSDGIEIYFPLTPSLILCIHCEKSYLPRNNNTSEYLPQNIEYVNHLQVIESDRYVFANNNSFGLVADMIRNNEC